MNATDIALMRTANQCIGVNLQSTPYEVVRHFGAIQAQDFASSLWAIALRTHRATLQDVELAIQERQIVRTWPMRGTLHFVAAEDLRWILTLLGPRIMQSMSTRKRQLGIDEVVLARARTLIVSMLQSGKERTRLEIFEALDQVGIDSKQQRGYHILLQLSLEQLICFGPHSAKQPTFVLLDQWVPRSRDRKLTRDESLVEIAKRYFNSHGFATINDFAGWTGLKITDARRGISLAGSYIQCLDSTDFYYVGSGASPKQGTFLLPAFDEFILGYKKRTEIMRDEHMSKIVPGNNGVFQPTIITNGFVCGLWRRTVARKQVTVQIMPFEPLDEKQKADIAQHLARYQAFIGKPVIVTK